MKSMFLKYREFIDECKANLHSSNFANKLIRLHELKARLHDVVSEWQIAGVDFCLALDEKGIFAEELKEKGETGLSSLLSHITIVSQQIESLEDMLDSYIKEYFEKGLVIEEKINAGLIISKEEYKSYEKINNTNPLMDSVKANAESLLKAKCYIDILFTLTANEGFGLLDEVNELLILLSNEFNVQYIQNSNSFDKIYLKYKLIEVGEDGLYHTIYDPVESRRLRKSYLTRHKRVLPENSEDNNTSENLLNEK